MCQRLFDHVIDKFTFKTHLIQETTSCIWGLTIQRTFRSPMNLLSCNLGSLVRTCATSVKLESPMLIYNKLYWRIKPKRHECKRDSKSHARHSTFLHTVYKLLLLNRLYLQQLISTHANCLELRQ